MRLGTQAIVGVGTWWRIAKARCVSLALLVLLVSSTLVVFPVSSGSASAAPIIMNVGTVMVPDTFNPFSMISGISWMTAWCMYERLTAYDDATLEPVPQLAESWNTSIDGTVWTFSLVQNSVWHDGTPVTAYDVEFTFNLIMNNPNECGLYANYVKNMTEAVAIDDYTMRFTTDVPKANMLQMHVPILPEHLWSAVPINQLGGVDLWNAKYFPNGPVGSGPMILESYDKILGNVRMLKWDQYHSDTINMDEVLYVIFTNENAMMNALAAGSIDLAMYVPNNLWDTTLQDPDIEGQYADQLDFHELGFNCASPSVRFATDIGGHRLFPKASDNIETWNVSVRQAIAMAINKTQIVNEILKGLADKGDTVIPPITPFWKYNVPESEEFKFDLDAANATLTAAGYEDIDDDGIRENTTSGVELSFEFYYPTGESADQLASQKISAWLQKIGINAPAEGMTETVLYQKWVNMEYDMFFWSWWPEYDPSWILSVLTTEEIPKNNRNMAAWSDTFYSNPVYDQLYMEQLTTVNLTDRQAIVHEMQRILYHDCPYVVLWYPYALFAYRTDRFTNYPDFTERPGATPGTYTFYFEVVPLGANVAPTADAGEDMTVYQGETVPFTGDATDPDDLIGNLTWNWTFEDPDHTIHTFAGRTVDYTFDQLGTANATLNVSDPSGGYDTDTAVITIIPVPVNVGWIVGHVNNSAGGPIVGAVVSAGGIERSTNVFGEYNLTLEAGTYTIVASATGYADGTSSETVVAGEVTLKDFVLEETSWTLRGHVYDAETSDPISDAMVTVLQGTTTVDSVHTNADGYYEILYIPFGTYTVRGEASGYEDNETTLTVSTPGEPHVMDIDLTPVAEGGGGLSTAAIAGIALVVIIVVAAAVLMFMRSKKKEEPPSTP